MPRLLVTAICTATLREEWVIDVTDEQHAEVQSAPVDERNGLLLDLLGGESTYVNVENVKVDDEREREVTGSEVVANNFTNAVEQ